MGKVILLGDIKFIRWLLTLGGIMVAMFIFNGSSNAKSIEASVYSWYDQQVENVGHTVETMDAHGIQSIYQFLSSDHLYDDQFVDGLNEFVGQMSENDKEVYFLNGEAEWALAEEQDVLISYVREVIAYKEKGHTVLCH